MLDYETINKVIGKGFADKLDEPIFDVGQMLYSRRNMVEFLGCANFVAAVRLQKVLRKLHIESPKELFDLEPMSLARAKGIGEAAMFVAMCILDANNYDVESWWGWKDNTVKFSTFKHHAIRKSRKGKQDV